MLHLYGPIGVPQLAPSGHLYPFLIACTAALVMRFERICEDMTPHGCPLIDRMIDNAQRTFRIDSITAKRRLEFWSASIGKDFDERKIFL